MKKTISFVEHFRVVLVLALLFIMLAGGSKAETVFGSDFAEYFACNGQSMTEAELAEYRSISLETAQGLNARGFVYFSELCDTPQAELDQAITSLENLNDTSEVSAEVYANALEDLETLQAEQGLSAASAGIDDASWNWIGPGNIGGRVQALAVHPDNSDIMWAGGISGGIWKTINGGESWQIQDDFMTSMSVTSIVINSDPADPTLSEILYASTGEKEGSVSRWIFRTIDGGSTWTQLGRVTDTVYIHDLAISADGNTLLAATEDGILRCAEADDGDNGDSNGNIDNYCQDVGDWGTLVYENGNHKVLDIAFSLTDPQRAVAGGEGGLTLYSDDGGSSWTAVPLEDVEVGMGHVEVAYGAGSVVYASATISDAEGGGDNGAYIYKSIDDGETFSTRIGSAGRTYLGDGGEDANTLWVDPDLSTTIVVGGINLYRSTDSGATITLISDDTQVPNFVHIAVSGSSDEVIFGTDGGIYHADNINSVTTTTGWTELNNNLGITEFSCIDVDGSGNVTGNTRSTGRVQHLVGDGTEAWTKITDGGDCSEDINPYGIPLPSGEVTRVVRYENSGTYYASMSGYNQNNIRKTINSGASWTPLPNLPIVMPVYDLEVSPGNPGYLYIGTEFGVFATEDDGANWSNTYSDENSPTSSSVRDLDLVGSTLYAATYGRGVFMVVIDDESSPPFNDDFDSAMDLSQDISDAISGENGKSMPYTVAYPDTTTVLDTMNATTAGDDPAIADCDIAPGTASVWYEYNPGGSTETLTFDTEGSTYDTYLAIWTGDRGNLAPIACNNDSGSGSTSQVGAQFSGNDSYYIEAGEYNGDLSGASVGGDLVLNISEAAAVDVEIGGENRGDYAVPKGSQERVTYDLNTGPVKIISTNNVPIIVALRESWMDNTTSTWTSFVQMMGLPESQLSDTYYFPSYNNRSLSGQLRFGNVDTTATWVRVVIGGVERGRYYLNPSEQKRVEYDLDTGPVVIESETSGVKIIAALRDSWWDGTRWTSFSQMMGLPKENLSDSYYFPSYNNRALSGQLRFGNVDTTATWVRVVIGGVERGRYYLNPSEQKRVEYDLDTGPVVIESETSGVKIIAALRDSWHDGVTWTSFVQMMGLPSTQLADRYYFPSYNNRSLSGQLRFGNVDTTATWVRVVIGGVERGRYYLDPSEQQRVEYNLNTGPVIIESETSDVKIIAALRDSWYDGARWTSFAQMMGLPENLLSTAYYFPAYNNRSLSGQFRFGAP